MGLGILAWLFFDKQHASVKGFVFVLLFGGVCAFGYAVVEASERSAQAQKAAAEQAARDQRDLAERKAREQNELALRTARESERAQRRAVERAERVALCVRVQTARFLDRQERTVENSVRCESGGLMGRGDSKTGMISFDAPPGYELVGTPEIFDRATNRGEVGAVQYARSGDAVTGVRVPISCRTPDQIGGPGGWAGAKLRATVERQMAESDRNRLRKDCEASHPA